METTRHGQKILSAQVVDLLIFVIDQIVELVADPATIRIRRLRRRLIVTALLQNGKLEYHAIQTTEDDD